MNVYMKNNHKTTSEYEKYNQYSICGKTRRGESPPPDKLSTAYNIFNSAT